MSLTPKTVCSYAKTQLHLIREQQNLAVQETENQSEAGVADFQNDVCVSCSLNGPAAGACFHISVTNKAET